MEKKFDSTELPLAELLGDVASGTLQLPDFQRGWVWDDDHIRSLLASISMSYPIGAVMTLQTGNAGVRFAPRPIEGAECGPTEPDLLLLDGQQRVTSLFLALKSRNPVPTRDARGNRLDRHYYANINAAIDPDCDREEDGIFSVPEDRVVRTDFGRVVALDLGTRGKEIAAEMFPLDIVLDPSATMDWQMAFLESGPGAPPERFEKWKQFQIEIVNPFLQYQVPTIKLAKSTRKEAVCQVFEKVNTGGVTLTVFELLTATYAADDFNLRDDWKARSSKFKEHKVLDGLRETDFLQVVTLLATYDRRRCHLAANPADEKAPAVSCKRRDVLRLALDEYRAWADTAADGLDRAAPFLHGESIFRSRDLPYATQLIPLGAIFGLLGHQADSFANRQRLRQWLWCGVFGELYGGASETRFAHDLQDCVAWAGEGDMPRTVRDAQFQAERLLTLRTRASAAYKGLYALQMQRGSRDFQTGAPIDVNAYFEHAIDVHHIFPRRWCENQRNVDIDRVADCAVNKTAIGAHANRFIGGNAPSVYLRRIEAHDGIDSQVLDGLLRSHDVDPAALRRDDFASFFNHRFERLLRQIEAAMGKPVNRSEHRDESPFVDKTGERDLDDVKALLQAGETQTVEFKATGRKNLRTGEKDAAMEWSVVKSICAFLNTRGGTLLVGADDAGKPAGIEEDYPFVKSGDRDGWELWLTDLVSKSMGPLAVTDLVVRFVAIDGRTVACIDARPAAKPVFATPLKGEKRQVFFIRLNNSTEELAGQALLDYQSKNWPA